MPLPFLSAEALITAKTDIVFVRAVVTVRQMGQFQRLQDSFDYQCRAEPGPKPKEHHSAALVTAQGLHRCIIHHPKRLVESLLVFEADPSGSQVFRLFNGLAVHDWTWVSNRN